VGDLDVGEGKVALGCFASDESLPRFSALADNISGILLVLAFSGEGKLVLGLAIRDLVDTEPLIGSPQEARKVSLDVLDIVELRSQRVVDIDDNDLPIGLFFVKQGHHAQDLDLLDLARFGDELANLANVQWVVVSLGLGLWVNNIGVFPGLREGTVVPEIALVREAVSHISELALLDILFDGIEGFLLANLHLSVGPARNFNNHIEDRLLLVGIKRDIVEWRKWDAIFLDKDAVLESVGRANLSRSIDRRSFGVVALLRDRK